MFQGLDSATLPRIGERNVEMALRVLKQIGIPVVFRDTGGTRGRMVTFDGTERTPLVKTLGGGRKP